AAEEATALAGATVPGERGRIAGGATEQELGGGEQRRADVALVQQFLDLQALRGEAELVGDHRGAAPGLGERAHLLSLPGVAGKRLLAKDVLSRLEGGGDHLEVRAGRGGDGDG